MLVLRVHLSLAGDLSRPIPSEGQNVGETGCPDVWERARPLQHPIDKGVLLRQTGQPKTRVDPEGSHPFRLKSRIHIHHAQKTPHQQSRANQQGAGKRDLGHYQPVAEPRLPLTAARPAVAISQPFPDRE
jgi:hypothetical protein